MRQITELVGVCSADGLARYLDIGSTKKIPKIGLGAHRFGSQEWE